MQIIIQKKYLILVEISENIFRLFLIVINFVFNVFEEAVEKTFNFIRALFGFNIYKLELVQIRTKTNELKNNFKNNNFLIYSNLLAPPRN